MCVWGVTNMAHSTLCHVDDGRLTECQSHFGQTAVLSVQLLAAEVRDPSVIRAEVVATETKVDTVEAAISYCG